MLEQQRQLFAVQGFQATNEPIQKEGCLTKTYRGEALVCPLHSEDEEPKKFTKKVIKIADIQQPKPNGLYCLTGRELVGIS